MTTAYANDKLYQIRAFLDAYNKILKEAIIPGKYLCVDESMNQWLGHGMPNLMKIPRKPHPIGQEWWTVADVQTCYIIRLDITGDSMAKKFDGTYPKTIATVFRLVEPWFSSGRTVIADSWVWLASNGAFFENSRSFLDHASEEEEILA
jgi:hypothetical protein